jgi:hypothetical protein
MVTRFRVRWDRIAWALAVGILFALLTLWALEIASLQASERTVNEQSTLPPCPTEDSTGCYWDADTMGNGRGHDVVTGEVTP